MKIRLLLLTMTGCFAVSMSTSAQTINFFSETGDIASLTTAGSPPDSGIEEVDGTGTIGSGTALRIWDLDTTDKGEVYLDVTPITTGFIFSYDPYNKTVTGSAANRLRFGNAGASLGTEANSISSISHETDGDLTYKYDNGAGGRSTDKVTPGLDTLHAVTVVFNVSASSLSYDLGSGSQSVAANSFDIYVDDMGTAVATDLPLHLDASTGYNTSLGVGKVGWTGSSNSGSGIDLLIDNATLTILVPEPSTYTFLLGFLAIGFVAYRRRK
jgi:hypothetical protein